MRLVTSNLARDHFKQPKKLSGSFRPARFIETSKVIFHLSDQTTNQGCALYPWFEEHGDDLIHPEDLEGFKALMPYGKVFEIGQANDTYVCLFYGSRAFQVKPDLLKKVEKARYRVGDKVEVNGKSGMGEIVDVMWHHKDAKPFFQITLDGNKKSNRYWESDLSAVVGS